MRTYLALSLAALALSGCARGTSTVAAAPEPAAEPARLEAEVARLQESLEGMALSKYHADDVMERRIDELMLYERLGDVAEVNIITFTGPPPANRVDSDRPGANNPLKIRGYVFIPRDLDRTRKQPLIVLPHGGVHGRFESSTYANIVREMLAQGYSVVAPEYRGSIGFGRRFWEQIDYGGLETEDTYAARDAALAMYPFLDPARVGLVGWSHGGLHALMNIFDHPESYAAAYAGVPVSDLIYRLDYKGPRYAALYSADYHIGRTVEEDSAEYRRRSPAFQAHRYQGTPLLIHTTTNDEDVWASEVQTLVDALEATGKEGWKFKLYQDAPGGHAFNRLDTPLARESRREIYLFLAEHLRPDRPVR